MGVGMLPLLSDVHATVGATGTASGQPLRWPDHDGCEGSVVPAVGPREGIHPTLSYE